MLTKSELAKYLKLSVRTVDRMMDYGMPYYKTSADNGSVRFDLEEIKTWMKNNAKK